MRKPRKHITDWDSTPIVNYLYVHKFTDEEHQSFHKEMMDFHTVRRWYPARDTGRPMSAVDFVRNCLNEQDYTWVGEFRYWVWERDNWRLLVSNQKGMCFELRENLTKEEVLAAWLDVRLRLGCAEPFRRGTRILGYTTMTPGVYVGPDPDYPGSYRLNFDNGERTTTSHQNFIRDNGEKG